MKKRKTPCPEGLLRSRRKIIHNSDVPIISDFDNAGQGNFGEVLPTSQLNRFIKRRELTNCLNLLESRGFSGETALFVLAHLQAGGGLA